MFEERPSGICPSMKKIHFEELGDYQSAFFSASVDNNSEKKRINKVASNPQNRIVLMYMFSRKFHLTMPITIP